MPEYSKPLPHIHPETQPFWIGLKKHELLLQCCRDCGKFYFYPRPFCPHCFSFNVEWVKASGRGRVYSFTISHKPASPAFQRGVPYNIAIIELDEGVRMMSNIVGCRNEDIAIGMAVEIVYDDVTPEVTLPRFKPVL